MTSRERILTAIAHQEPDHVPLLFEPFGYERVLELPQGRTHWADYWLRQGVDASLKVSVPWRLREGTAVRVWDEDPPGGPGPVVVGEYQTPKGTLRHAVRKTADWPYGPGELSLFSDHNPPRALEHPVKSEQDLDALEYLFDVPDAAVLARLRDEARQTRRDADDRGVIVEGHCTTGGDSMAWLCGFDHMVYYALDSPPFIHRLLDIIHRNEIRRLEMLLDLGVIDIVVRRAWYESLRSVNLGIYREFLAPLIRHEAELAHQAGLPYMYICTASTMGLLPIWKEIGVDIIWGVDPVQGDADLNRLQAEAGEWLSFWGGINSWVTLQRGSDAEIRQAVEAAVRALGPGGGLVLMPVDALGADVPPHALDVLLDAWRACAAYPLAG